MDIPDLRLITIPVATDVTKDKRLRSRVRVCPHFRPWMNLRLSDLSQTPWDVLPKGKNTGIGSIAIMPKLGSVSGRGSES